jgi:hypothetical protein
MGMQRSAQHIARLLVCAAVPVILVAGCTSSSSTGSDSAAAKNGASPAASTTSASPSPTLRPGKYAKLPGACGAITRKTVKSLVPKAKSASGDAARSSDTNSRGGCSWNGLNGFQYRWLDVSLQRFDSVAGIGSADTQATKRYQEQVGGARTVKGAKPTMVSGLGDEATAVTAQVTKDKEQYQEITVVSRTGNAVVVLSYNGAGFENAKTPKAADLRKDAVAAAKEAVAAVAAANSVRASSSPAATSSSAPSPSATRTA